MIVYSKIYQQQQDYVSMFEILLKQRFRLLYLQSGMSGKLRSRLTLKYSPSSTRFSIIVGLSHLTCQLTLCYIPVLVRNRSRGRVHQ
jgi:hypothetical protein